MIWKGVSLLTKFYKIGAWSIGGPKYPWAAGYGPLPSMPFFEGLDDFRKSKEAFWKVSLRPPGMAIDPGGREWSDIIGCGGGPPWFFVSQRIVDSLQREGIPTHRTTVMPIAKVASKRLASLVPPAYYVLEAAPGIALDFAAMGVAVDEEGRQQLTRAQRLNPPPSVFDMKTWTGSDLFCISNRFSPINLHCTERVKELAEKEKWTNCDFKPVGGWRVQ